jgi:hypothetical protein
MRLSLLCSSNMLFFSLIAFGDRWSYPIFLLPHCTWKFLADEFPSNSTDVEVGLGEMRGWRVKKQRRNLPPLVLVIYVHILIFSSYLNIKPSIQVRPNKKQIMFCIATWDDLRFSHDAKEYDNHHSQETYATKICWTPRPHQLDVIWDLTEPTWQSSEDRNR